jgi:hypothetical protein
MARASNFRPRALLAAWLAAEALLCAYQVHTEPTYTFDWDAYMEQAALFSTGSGGNVTASPPSLAASSSPIHDYSRLVGDTGPLAYPAVHLWAHAFLFRATGWDVVRWTTEYDPKGLPGYEARTRRPEEVLAALQLLYAGLWIITCAAAGGVALMTGMVRRRSRMRATRSVSSLFSPTPNFHPSFPSLPPPHPSLSRSSPPLPAHSPRSPSSPRPAAPGPSTSSVSSTTRSA